MQNPQWHHLEQVFLSQYFFTQLETDRQESVCPTNPTVTLTLYEWEQKNEQLWLRAYVKIKGKWEESVMNMAQEQGCLQTVTTL